MVDRSLLAGEPVLALLSSLSRYELIEGLIAERSGIAVKRIRSGMYSRRSWLDLTSAAASLADAPLYVNDEGGYSRSKVRNLVSLLSARLGRDRKIGLVVVEAGARRDEGASA